MNIAFRQARVTDAQAIHQLIHDNLEAGHLLPRSLDDVMGHAGRFIVAEADGAILGCGELARLSEATAEVRSLVVDERVRGNHIGPRLVAQLAAAGVASGFSTLCAFTHDPSHFVRLGFTIVPHIWVPEKIEHDCRTCPQFRRCGQYAVTMPLRSGVVIRPEQPAALIHSGRSVAGRRPNIERLHLEEVSA